MGAIYGLIGDVDASFLNAMGIRLKHRGKTTIECKFDQNIQLGECPHNDSAPSLVTKELVVVADADIYNATELRQLLVARGRVFETERDEEVILQGYAEFGPHICEHLDGDFAFALWDSARSVLLLARDPLGSRPLYYWHSNDLFAFASEYKALLALPFVPVEADLEAIQYLQYTKYPPPNRTLLRDIVWVPSGHYIEYSDGHCQGNRYWDISINLTKNTEAQHAELIRNNFLSAVKKRLDDLTVVGATLSGGIDSAAVVAAIRKVRPDISLHTFTCGYGPEDPEIQTAAIVAKAIGTVHHPLVVEPEEIPQLLPQIVWHLEDPIARSENVQIFETAKYAAKHVDVVLAGYASDGLYGGMPKHKIIRLIQWFPWMKTPFEEFYNYTQVSAVPESVLGKVLHQAYFRGSDSQPPAVLGASLLPPAEPLPVAKKELLNQVLKAGVVNGVPKWLPKADRLHLAHGLRFRSPYTDLNLIQNAFQISDQHKIRYWREKHILRKALKPLLPAEVLNRPKFPQAMKYDFAFSEVLEEMSNEILSAEVIRSRSFFDLSDIERIRKRPHHKPYSSEQAMRLWTAILTELWAQIFLDRRGEPLTLLEAGTP